MSKQKSKAIEPPLLSGLTMVEPQNIQQPAWAACLKIQSNARLSEKIKTIVSEHTAGEQGLIRKLVKVWAREVGLKEHFPGLITDPLCPEIPYYLDYCERVNKKNSRARQWIVPLARAIVTKDIHSLANLYAAYETETATTNLIHSLRLGGQVGNITWNIGKGDIDRALEIITACLRGEEVSCSLEHAIAAADREAKTEKPEGEDNAARIAMLRLKIDKLLCEGEAHNESGIFRLEREIYDLEYESDLDEWSEIISD